MQLIETYTDLPVESRTSYRIIAENKLVQVDKYDSTPTLISSSTYSYDGFGRRVKKSVDGAVTYYVYDMEDIRFETDELGTITAEYTHGPGIDEPLAMRRNGSNYYYHVNGLGSITALTDSSTDSPKTVVQSYVYDSFGQIISQSGSIQNPYTYTGREYDPETGMYYYRARYYDAKMGRFISEDPIGIKGGINQYAYVENNPISFTDPMGLAIWICNRKTNWGIGNHAYFWDDRTGECCGMGSTKGCKEAGPSTDACRKIPGSDGREDGILKCCRETADDGLWFPPINDCHEALDDCLEKAGLTNPGAPGGRLGPACDPCNEGSW